MDPSYTRENYVFPFLPYVQTARLSNTIIENFGPENDVDGYRNDFDGLEAGALDWTQAVIPNNLYAPAVNYTVNKTGDGGAPLAGATFTLTGGPSQGIPAVTTGADGKAVFQNVMSGTYTLTETGVPEGYNGAQPQQVIVDGDHREITVVNTLKPVEIKIISVDQRSAPIPGTVFRLVDMATGNYIGDRYITGGDGTVTVTGLTRGGNYRVEQVSVPAGYTAGAETSKLATDLIYGVTYVNFTNIQNTHSTVNVNLKKVDTMQNLAGGVFEIWSVGDNPQRLHGPVTTDANGNAQFTRVLNGAVYEVRQTVAPKDYGVAASQILDLSEELAPTTKNLQFYNSSVQLIINLTEEGTPTPLSGATFVAKQGDKVIAGPVTTDGNGNAILAGFLLGETYTIEQTDAPVGFMPGAPVSVTLTDMVQELPLTNSPLELVVRLTTAQGAPLQGSEFVVKDDSGETLATGTTDAEGTIIWTGAPLEYGKSYTIEQTSAQTGYTPAPPASIVINRPRTEVPFTNGETGSLEVTLYETGTTTPLAGASFVVKDANGTIIGSPQTTDNSGKAVFPGLVEGQRYTIEQLEAPLGFVPTTPREIIMMGEVMWQTLYNNRGDLGMSGIRITVVDSENSNIKLEGAEFQVVGPDGRNYTLVTNAQGLAVLSNIPNGEYTVYQTKAPGGYIPDANQLVQVVSNEIWDITVQNVYIGDGASLRPGIIKVNVYESAYFTGPRVEGVTIQARDNRGNIYYTTTDSNGVAYFSGLDITRSYELVISDAPFKYGTGPWPDSAVTIVFADPTTPLYREAHFKIDLTGTERLEVKVYEAGDYRIPIVGAVIELTNPDGTKLYATTDSNGYVIFPELPQGFDYEVRQITTDANHIKSDETYVRYVLRFSNVDIPNKLINPGTVTNDIIVKKDWPEGAPNPMPAREFTLFANGVSTGQTRTLAQGSTADTVTFAGQPKYDATHTMIRYTVKETPIPDYYAVHTKNDEDGYNWTISNFEGSMVGECVVGTWWQSKDTLATEYNPDGSITGRTINLPGSFTYGFGTATTPYPMADGKQYLIGMERYGKLTMWDITANPAVEIRTGSGPLITGYGAGGAAANTLGISMDGKWLLAAGGNNRTMHIFNAQAVVTAMLNGTALPASHSTFQIPTTNTSDGFAGDVVELENGDLLMSVRHTGLSHYGTGLMMAQKTGEGTWGNAKHVGDLAFPYDDGTKYIESLARVWVDGEWKIVVSQATSRNTYQNYTLNTIPSYSNPNSTTYQLTPFGPEGSQPKTPISDATDSSMAPCEAFIKVRGTKNWLNDTPEDRPESITVEVLQNGQSMNPKVTKVITPDANGNWKYEFSDLPKYQVGGKRHVYTVREIGIPLGYTVSYPDEGTVPNYDIINTRFESEIVLEKQDGHKKIPLAGALFQLYGADQETPIGPAIRSDAEGKIHLGSLKAGEYWLEELEAPEGFVPYPELRQLVISADEAGNPVVTIDGVPNTTLMNYHEENAFIGIHKVDEDLHALTGAVFKIEKTGGPGEYQGKYEIHESAGGTPERFGIFRDLTEGTYRIWEDESPDGYLITTDFYTLEVDKVEVDPGRFEHQIKWIRKHTHETDPGVLLYDRTVQPPIPSPEILELSYLGYPIVGLQVVNRKNRLELMKTDGENRPLAGAVFDLYVVDDIYGTSYLLEDGTRVNLRQVRDENNVPVRSISGPDGAIHFEKLAPGTYYVLEQSAPPGYTLLEHPKGPYEITQAGWEAPDPPAPIQNHTAISVKLTKQWEGGTRGTPVMVQFQLQRRLKGSSDPFENVPNGTISLPSDGETQTYTWTDLDGSYEYQVVELTLVDGYAPGEVVLSPEDPNDITIINRKVEYPATGGMGTLPYLLPGLGLMAGAVFIRKRQRKGGDRST